jgi:lipopolysaccharide export LptBFGC system permease protein LptF
MAPPVLDGWVRRVTFPGFRPNEVPSLLALLLLLPQALALTLPAALLMAIPLGLSRHRPSPRLTRRTIGLSMCCAAVTFVMMAWVMPEANQAFRVLISGDHRLVRGPSENGFAKMRREIERLRTFHGGETIVRRLTFGYQQRLALAVAPIPLGLFALAITVSAKGRRRPWLVGAAGLAFYVAVFYPVMALAQFVLARAPAIPVLVFAWAPNALVLLVAALLHLRKHTLPALTTRHSRPNIER